MSRRRSVVAGMGLLALLHSRPLAAETGRAPNPVVLELFTSQGCSSCPPAEDLLSALGADEQIAPLVIPLAFHVDYWDGHGWADPFSQARWTERQAGYCRDLGVPEGPYTPQLVVNGRAQFNGADRARVLYEIEAARRGPALASVHLAAGPGDGKAASIEVRVDAQVHEELSGDRLELFVALVESGLNTSIARGENAGRTQRGDFVVRRLTRAFSLPGRSGSRQERLLRIDLPKGSREERLGLAAWLQDPRSRRIYAAAALAHLE